MATTRLTRFRAVLLDDIAPEVDQYALRGKKGVKPMPGQGEFQWITIGAEPGQDGKKHGGHPVMIDANGVMQTGKFSGQTMKEAFGKGNQPEKPDSSKSPTAQDKINSVLSQQQAGISQRQEFEEWENSSLGRKTAQAEQSYLRYKDRGQGEAAREILRAFYDENNVPMERRLKEFRQNQPAPFAPKMLEPEAKPEPPAVGTEITSRNRPGHIINQNLHSHLTGQKKAVRSLDEIPDEPGPAMEKASGIQPVTRPNAQAQAGDQLGLFGEAARPKRDAAPTLAPGYETRGRQQSLFDTKGPADQQMLFATDYATPDEMIGGKKPEAVKPAIYQPVMPMPGDKPTREEAEAALDAANKERAKMVRMMPPGQLVPTDTERWNSVNDAVRKAEEAMKPFYAEDRKAKEAEAEERSRKFASAEEKRIAALPVKQKRNGWNLATDGTRWYVKDPNTGESIYNGSLTRAREVADEAAPDNVEPDDSQKKRAEVAKPEAKGPMSLADYKAYMNRVDNGEVTPDEHREAYERFKAGRDGIRAELAKMKKEDVAAWHHEDGISIYSPYADRDKKDRVVDSAMRRLEEEFDKSPNANQWSFNEDLDAKRAKAVSGITAEHLKAHAEKSAKERAERDAARKQRQEAADNPKTAADWMRKRQAVGGYHNLTPEQQAAHDDAYAAHRREMEPFKPPQQTKVSGFQGGTEKTGNIGIVQGHHQKRNAPTWTVTIEEHLGDSWKEALSRAKTLGGNYVNARIARAYGATPGFQFFNEDAAKKFHAVMGGETADISDNVDDREAEKRANQVDSLAERAAAIIARAESSLGRDRKDNTARRARMAASAEADARKELATAKTMQALANRIEEGKANHLKYVRNKAQVDELDQMLNRAKWNHFGAMQKQPGYKNKSFAERDAMQSAPPSKESIAHTEYPYPYMHRSEMQSMAGKLEDVPGLKMFAKGLMKMSRELNKGDYGQITDKGDLAKLREAIPKMRRHHSPEVRAMATRFNEKFEAMKRLEGMDINNTIELRAALREYHDLKQNPEGADPIKEAERKLKRAKIDGFFPTPRTLVEKMLDHADIEEGQEVLEPSAGIGTIMDAIKERHPGVKLHGIEKDFDVSEVLGLKGHQFDRGDFLEHAKKYDRIVMNPPFENRQDEKHVKHAYELLKPGGKLVAITGSGAHSNERSESFRDWLATVGAKTYENPEGSFDTDEAFRKTKVNTHMVIISKPTETTKEQYAQMYDTNHHKIYRPVLIDRYSEEKDKWITIGGEEGADGKKHGGQPVLIGGDGKIKAGMGGKFEGKTLGQAFGGKGQGGEEPKKDGPAKEQPKPEGKPKAFRSSVGGAKAGYKVGDRFSHKGQMYEVASAEKPYYMSSRDVDAAEDDDDDFGLKVGYYQHYTAKPVEKNEAELKADADAKAKADEAKARADAGRNRFDDVAKADGMTKSHSWPAGVEQPKWEGVHDNLYGKSGHGHRYYVGEVNGTKVAKYTSSQYDDFREYYYYPESILNEEAKAKLSSEKARQDKQAAKWKDLQAVVDASKSGDLSKWQSQAEEFYKEHGKLDKFYYTPQMQSRLEESGIDDFRNASLALAKEQLTEAERKAIDDYVIYGGDRSAVESFRAAGDKIKKDRIAKVRELGSDLPEKHLDDAIDAVVSTRWTTPEDAVASAKEKIAADQAKAAKRAEKGQSSSSKPAAHAPKKAASATWTKLKSGAWGARVVGEVAKGDSIAITAKDGRKQTKTVGKVVYNGDGYSLAEVYAATEDEAREIQRYAQAQAARYVPVLA